MYCKNCGVQLQDNAKFCNNCGVAISEDKVNLNTKPRKVREDELGVIALCLGIASIFVICSFIFMWAAIFPGIAAIVTGVIKIKRNNGDKGIAIAGIVTGVISSIITVISIVLLVLLIAYAGKNANKTFSFDYGNSGRHYGYNYSDDQNNQNDSYYYNDDGSYYDSNYSYNESSDV